MSTARPRNVVLIDHTGLLSQNLAATAARALQVQINQDLVRFYPETSATVIVWENSDGPPPLSAWQVNLINFDPDKNAAEQGYHAVRNGMPFAEVKIGASGVLSDIWSIALSHEVIEMLVDPWRKALEVGQALDDGGNIDLSHQVSYRLEPCDPVAGAPGQIIQNYDVPLSDFCSRRYYSDRQRESGVDYSAYGSVKAPLDLLSGGYLTYTTDNGRTFWRVKQDGDTFFPPSKLSDDNRTVA